MKKKTGVRAKLIFVIIPVVLLLIACFFLISRRMLIERDQERLEAEASAYAKDIESWADRIMGELKVFEDAINLGTFDTDEEILAFLETSVETNSAYPAGIYMGDDSGVIWTAPAGFRMRTGFSRSGTGMWRAAVMTSWPSGSPITIRTQARSASAYLCGWITRRLPV